ncbi:MAG: hypothetical protein IPN76_34995 [Saprospiraceae bacterium]|nr:hypothetical protein [Saprospiraceae bacterium]
MALKKISKIKELLPVNLAISEEMGMDDYRASILLFLSDLALVDGDFPNGTLTAKNTQDIRDTITSNALVHAVQELEVKHETQAKEQKIKDLNKKRSYSPFVVTASGS